MISPGVGAFGALVVVTLVVLFRRFLKTNPSFSAPAGSQLKSWEELPEPTSGTDPVKWLQVHAHWLRWAKECGWEHGMYRTPSKGKANARRTVIVTDPTLVGPLYTKLPKDEGYTRFHFIVSPKLPVGDGVFTAFGEEPLWRATRKYVAPFFSWPNLRTKVPVLNEKSQLLCRKIREHGADKPFEAQDASKRLTLDTFLLAGGFGFEMNALDFKPCQFLQDLQKVFWEAAICSLDLWRRWKFTTFTWFYRKKGAYDFVGAHTRCYAMWEKVWSTMEAMPPPSDKDNSLAACFKRLAASEEGRVLKLKRKQHVWQTGGMLVAGLDSQGLTLSFTLQCMAAFPHKQALFARELQRMGLLATPEQPNPRDVNAEDLPKMLFLEAAVKESERLLPVTGLGTARYTAKDMQIGNYWIPGDTRIMIAAAIMHQDPKSYAEPEDFIPERWLADLSPAAIARATGSEQPDDKATAKAISQEAALRKEASLDPDVAQRLKYRFATFSHGSRGCPGYNFATMQLMTVMANIIGRFEVSLAPQMGGWKGCQDKEVNAFTLMSSGGNWLLFKPRAP